MEIRSLIFRSNTGKFVSESKFIENPAAFIPHILKPNRQVLEALITKPEVERKLLLRLRKKAATYAQDIAVDDHHKFDAESPKLNGVSSHANGESPKFHGLESPKLNGTDKIDVDGVVDLYESYIIPLTKEVEVSWSCLRYIPEFTSALSSG